MAEESAPWLFEGESTPLTTNGPSTTIVDGRTMALSSQNGDIDKSLGAQGFFFMDMRLISKLKVLINGRPISSLGNSQTTAFSSQFVGRYMDDKKLADYPIVVSRKRTLDSGLTEEIQINNFGLEETELSLTVIVESDYADLFTVKEGKNVKDEKVTYSQNDNSLWINSATQTHLQLEAKPDIPGTIIENKISWEIAIQPGSDWTTTLEFHPWVQGIKVGLGQNQEQNPNLRHKKWFETTPTICSNNTKLGKAINQSLIDLESLRIFNTDFHDKPIFVAGAPWFMTLFGRDSLITAWMSMIIAPDLAAGVLETLAKFQGQKVNKATDEAPGKIMHEVRFNKTSSGKLEEGSFYYGTADATQLFVMTLAELDRWDEAPEIVQKLIPNARKAIKWILEYGDIDGDGFIEYDRSAQHGLYNQGWKDSGDGIRFNDGSIPRTPIALCEIQGYTYAAYRSMARLEEKYGDPEEAKILEKKAKELKEKFNKDFWIEEKGWYAVGLDKDKKQIDSLTSNLGHCLWTGIIDEDKASRVAELLLSEEMFTGWGIRTMSKNTHGYNPTGYHTGSVWPHDTAIAAAGLMRYGFIEESHQVMMSILDLAEETGWRLPELFSGFDRSEFEQPIAYPASCSPQAWSAAAPLLILRWILRIDPWCSHERVWIDPVLPEGITKLRVENIKIAKSSVTVTVNKGKTTVEGLPDYITWQHKFRTMAAREKYDPQIKEAWNPELTPTPESDSLNTNLESHRLQE